MPKNVDYGVLKDYDGNDFLPITHSKLVYDENGNTVESRLITLERDVDSIQEQDAFKSIKVGATIIEADQSEDTLELAAGSGIKLTGDATNDKVTIAHNNNIAKKDSFIQNTNASSSGDSFTVTEVKYDTEGHITGKQEKTIILPSDISGNANSATQLQNPVTITITDNNGHNGNATTFNGKSNVTLDLPDVITADIECKDEAYFFIDNADKVVAKVSGAGIETTDVRVSGDIYFNNTSLKTLAEDVITGVSAGNGLTGGGSNGNVTLNIGQGNGISVAADTVSHADTSTLSGVQNAGTGKAITSITVDEFGHVTATNSGNVINSIATTGSGNAITSATNTNGVVTFAKEKTFKTQQTAVSTPDASGNATAFIDSFSQNANGEITGITKKNIPSAGTALGLVKSGGDVTINNGVITVNDDSHNHTISNIDNLQNTLDVKYHNVEPGSTEGSVKLISASGNKEVTVNGLGHTGDGKYYFIDNKENVSAYIDGNGVHSTEFRIPETNVQSANVKAAVSGDLSLTGAYEYAIGVKDSLNNNTIKVTTTDDDVVNLTSSSGVNAVAINATHAQKGPASGYVSGNSVVAVGTGTGESGKIKIPQISVDKYGHVTAAADEEITIKMPSAADLGLTKAMIFLGTTTTPLIDGISTKPIKIDNKDVTPTNGNVVLYDGKEFVWNGSSWEELGAEGSHALNSIKIEGDGTVLTGGGDLTANRTISHGKKFGSTNTTAKYTSGNTETSISGSGDSGTIKIPQLTVDEYGHVTAAVDESITITMPNSISGNAGSADKWKTPRNFSITDNAGHTGSTTSVNGESDISLDLPDTIAANLVGNISTTDDYYAFIDTNNNTLAIIQNGGIKTVDVFDKNNNALSTAVQTVKSSDTASTATVAGVNVNDSRSENNVTISGTLAAATQSTAGAMTAEDKKKLDGITASADAVSYAQTQTSGTTIGTITINGTATAIKTPAVNNATITISPGTGLKTGGDFTTNQSSAETITLNHKNSVTAKTKYEQTSNVSTAGSSFKLTEVQYDSEGHITAAQTKTITLPNQVEFADKWTTARNFRITDNHGHYSDSVSVNGNSDVDLNLPKIIEADLIGNIENNDDSYSFIDSKNNVLAIVKNGGIHTVDVFDKNNNALSTAVQTIEASGTTPLSLSASRNGNKVSIVGSISAATTSTAGAMSAADKTKLDGIAANANNYSLPVATSSTRGGIKIGFSQTGKKYPVQLSSEKAYVEVPWIDTTYGTMIGASSSDAGAAGLVPAPTAGNQNKYLRGDGTWATPTNTTYGAEKGIELSSGKFGHTNSVTAATAQGSSTKTLEFGKTFTIPTITYDAQGHITGKGTTTMTMPANPDTGATSITTSGSGNAITGASYSATNREITLTKGYVTRLYSSDNAGYVSFYNSTKEGETGTNYFLRRPNKTEESSDNYYLGSENYRWNKIYTNDLILSNLQAVDQKISVNNQMAILGDLLLGNDGSSEDQYDLYIRRKVNGALKSARSYWHSDGHYVIQAASDNAVKNYIYLKDDKTEFKQPVAINSGGTGASTAKAARANLFSGLSGTTSGNKFKAVFNSTDDALYTTIPYASKDNIGLLNTEKQEISGYKFFHNYLFAPINVAKGTTPSTTTSNALIFTDNNINNDKKYRYSMVCGQVYKESRDSTIGLYVYQASNPSVDSNLTDGATKNASFVLHAPNETGTVPYISTFNIEYIKTKRFAVNEPSYGTSAPTAADGIVTGQIYYHIID